MNLFGEMKKLQGRTLYTLGLKRPFEVREFSSNTLVVKTSSGENRSIPWKELENAWAHLEKHKRITREEIRELGYSNFHPAYVISLIANMPGVAHRDKPITLSLES